MGGNGQVPNRQRNPDAEERPGASRGVQEERRHGTQLGQRGQRGRRLKQRQGVKSEDGTNDTDAGKRQRQPTQQQRLARTSRIRLGRANTEAKLAAAYNQISSLEHQLAQSQGGLSHASVFVLRTEVVVAVGAVVGAGVGPVVGAAVGTEVGTAVGAAVGAVVGTALGIAVGAAVGDDVVVR